MISKVLVIRYSFQYSAQSRGKSLGNPNYSKSGKVRRFPFGISLKFTESDSKLGITFEQ